jgi:hypothetical protein
MASQDRDPRSETQQSTVDRIRATLADGLATIKGREKAQSIACLTMEEALSQAINDITVDRSDIRPCATTRVRQLKEQVLAAVDQALQMPAELFELHAEAGTANTNRDGSQPTDELEEEPES